MRTRHLVVLGALFLMAQARAACVASDPIETARWIHANERSFPFQQQGRDPTSKLKFLSKGLYSLLAAEWKCQDKEQGPCALGADPWVDSNGGGEQPPFKFELATSTQSSATVRMSYRFAFNGPNDPKSSPAETRLEFVRDPSSGCWLLDNLVSRGGNSLKKTLEP